MSIEVSKARNKKWKTKTGQKSNCVAKLSNWLWLIYNTNNQNLRREGPDNQLKLTEALTNFLKVTKPGTSKKSNQDKLQEREWVVRKREQGQRRKEGRGREWKEERRKKRKEFKSKAENKTKSSHPLPHPPGHFQYIENQRKNLWKTVEGKFTIPVCKRHFYFCRGRDEMRAIPKLYEYMAWAEPKVVFI